MNDPKAPSDWFAVDGVDELVELALNLHWSWNHAADELWEGLDKELWASTQNPWVILRTVSREKIKAALGAPEFRRRLDSLLDMNRESEVIPEFYERDESGMPSKWLGRIRESMARLTPEFSATRAIREYTEGHYLPAASGYRDRAANDGALGSSLLQWKRILSGIGVR